MEKCRAPVGLEQLVEAGVIVTGGGFGQGDAGSEFGLDGVLGLE